MPGQRLRGGAQHVRIGIPPDLLGEAFHHRRVERITEASQAAGDAESDDRIAFLGGTADQQVPRGGPEQRSAGEQVDGGEANTGGGILTGPFQQQLAGAVIRVRLGQCPDRGQPHRRVVVGARRPRGHLPPAVGHPVPVGQRHHRSRPHRGVLVLLDPVHQSVPAPPVRVVDQHQPLYGDRTDPRGGIRAGQFEQQLGASVPPRPGSSSHTRQRRTPSCGSPVIRDRARPRAVSLCSATLSRQRNADCTTPGSLSVASSRCSVSVTSGR